MDCRAAHNAETNRYRGLSQRQRAHALEVLRAGGTAAAAAEAIGKPVGSLSRAAARDSELRAALNGRSLEQQVLARQGDFLAALTRHGGNGAEAAAEIGLEVHVPSNWRREPPYAAAEKAVLELIAAASGQRRRRRSKLTAAMIREVVDLLHQGASVSEAARRVGVSQALLHFRAQHHTELAEAMKLRQGRYGRPATPQPSTRVPPAG